MIFNMWMDQGLFAFLTAMPESLSLPPRGSQAMAYLGFPGSAGTASDSFSGSCRPDTRNRHNCTLCPCRGNHERGAACSVGRRAGHQSPCTCESEACQTCPRRTATSARASMRASYPPRQVFLIKGCCFCF